MECPNCGGELIIDPETRIAVCQNCGAEFEDRVSDEVQIEAGKREVEKEKLRYKMEQDKKKDEENRVKAFKSGKFSKLIIAFAVICGIACAVQFMQGQPLPGIIALIQTILFALAALAGFNAIRTKRGRLHITLTVIGLLLIVPFLVFMDSYIGSDGIGPGRNSHPASEEIDWGSLALSDHLPQPDQTMGHINYSNSDKLSVEVTPVSESEMKTYLDRCKDMGYTVDEYFDNYNDYVVFNEDGYRLDLFYYNYDQSMQIVLDAPIEMEELDWPAGGIAAKIPKPDSDEGKIVYEGNDNLEVYVGNTTKKDYNQYIRKCLNMGFDVDYDRYERDFFAENKGGDRLRINYYGNGIMYIDIYN